MVKIKAIILAAGKGTRLKPLTENIPKPLVKINHISILEYILDQLTKLNINNIALIVSHQKEQIIEKIIEILKNHCKNIHLKRLEENNEIYEVLFIADFSTFEDLTGSKEQGKQD